MRILFCVLSLCIAARTQDATLDFVRDVAPVLQRHCVACHGAEKQKGDLRLDGRDHVLKPVAADAEVVLVQAGKPDESEMIRRVELQDGDDDAMPQKGERLSAKEVSTLRAWIQEGATWPDAADAWFAEKAAAATIPKLEFGIAVLDAAAQAKVDAAMQKLALRGVLAQQVAADTPAVDVNASLVGPEFGDADLALLQDLAPVLVWLNLARTKITDDGLAVLAAMPQLRRLSLANTGVGDRGLAALGAPAQIEILNVYGSQVTDAGLKSVASWPQLQKVYAFSNAVTAEGAAAAISVRSALVVDRGDYAEARLKAAEVEIATRKERDAPANSVCIVSGEQASAEHFVDLDGLRVAFCCQKCKKKYTDDPAAFADKVAALREQKANGKAEKQ